jgi:hypothetical protein
MTWVVGRAGPFGYGVAVSDVRVTFPDGSERDCLQKIHKIGPDLAVGFAGSVAIGLEIVRQLTVALGRLTAERALDPSSVAKDLPLGTRQLFAMFPADVRRLGCELLLLGPHPQESDGAAPWPKCYLYRFQSPKFDPIPARADEIVSIGSGSGVQPYADALKRLAGDFEMLKLESLWRGGAGLGLMEAISAVINKHPVSGISRHVHLCLVGPGRVLLGNNDRTRQERPQHNFIMPPVARTWDEYVGLASGGKVSAAQTGRC